MKNFVQTIILCTLVLSLNSCFVNRTTIGDGPIGKGNLTARYSHVKQMYVLWGLLPINQAQPVLPQGCGYQVKSSFNFIDALVSGITLGIFDMRTVKILVKKDSPCDPAILKIERKEDKEIHKLEEKEQR
jgi:hypothetical protein